MKYLPLLIIPLLVYGAIRLLPSVNFHDTPPLLPIQIPDGGLRGGAVDDETKVVVGFEEYVVFPEAYEYMDLNVYEEVTYLGWSDKLQGRTVCTEDNLSRIAQMTRSDVLVTDGIACLYVTSGVLASPSLDSIEPGQKSLIKGKIRYLDGKPYIGPPDRVE